jgi:hypothetical protein
MKKLFLSLMIAGLMLATLVVTAVAAPGGVTNRVTLKELAQARRATAQYNNAELPVSDGWAGHYQLPVAHRVPGMGYHYVNPALIDGTFNAAEPEVLIYDDAGRGRRLIAVEYIVITGGPPPSGFTGSDDVWAPAPPPPGVPPGTWTLHAWIWEGNPDGVFAPLNPSIP